MLFAIGWGEKKVVSSFLEEEGRGGREMHRFLAPPFLCSAFGDVFNESLKKVRYVDRSHSLSRDCDWKIMGEGWCWDVRTFIMSDSTSAIRANFSCVFVDFFLPTVKFTFSM